jgi:hypothetical protein
LDTTEADGSLATAGLSVATGSGALGASSLTFNLLSILA